MVRGYLINETTQMIIERFDAWAENEVEDVMASRGLSKQKNI